VLSVDGRNVMKLGYAERREILEGLGLNDPFWRTPAAVDDGAALWEAVCEHELEGVVAKRRSGDTCPAAAGWIKTKNRAALARRAEAPRRFARAWTRRRRIEGPLVRLYARSLRDERACGDGIGVLRRRVPETGSVR
jgi:hypothetical protein